MPREHSMPATQSNCFISSTISLFLPWFFQPSCKLFNATFKYGQNVYIVHYTFLFLSEVFHTKKLKRFGHLRHFSMGWAHSLHARDWEKVGGGRGNWSWYWVYRSFFWILLQLIRNPSTHRREKKTTKGEKEPVGNIGLRGPHRVQDNTCSWQPE